MPGVLPARTADSPPRGSRAPSASAGRPPTAPPPRRRRRPRSPGARPPCTAAPEGEAPRPPPCRGTWIRAAPETPRRTARVGADAGSRRAHARASLASAAPPLVGTDPPAATISACCAPPALQEITPHPSCRPQSCALHASDRDSLTFNPFGALDHASVARMISTASGRAVRYVPLEED